MRFTDNSEPRTNRRQLLRAFGAVGAGSLALGSARANGDTRGEDDDRTYVLVQGSTSLELTPLSGSVSAEELYDWDEGDTLYSSEGTTELQRPDTSVLFLYEGPDGDISLVIIHGKLGGDQDGGSATFRFAGLPDSGEWLVQDDFYDGPNRFDNWEIESEIQTVDWTWAGGRTDGGVFGPLEGDSAVAILPAFNEGAALFGEYYEGRIEQWEVLSGDMEDPDRQSLSLDQPIGLGQTRSAVDERLTVFEEETTIEYGERTEKHLQQGVGRDPQYGDLAQPVTFEGESGDSVRMTLESWHFDPYLVLEGPDGEIVGEDDDGAGGLDSQIETTLSQSGQFTIWAGSYSGWGTGDYTLELRANGGSDTGTIERGETVHGTIESGSGHDPQYGDLAQPVTFKADGHDSVEITMESTHLDPYLLLEDPHGRVVCEDDDGASGLNSRLSKRLSESGEYTIWAGSYSGWGTGDYTLTLR